MKAYALLGGPTELWPEDIEEKLAQADLVIGLVFRRTGNNT